MVTICLWFDDQAEEAAQLYTTVLRGGSLGRVARYDEVSAVPSGKEPGSVLTVEFEAEGQSFTALNGGPVFKFNEAVSLILYRDTQKEIDEVWAALTEGGRGAAVRVAQGPLRRLVAGRAQRPARAHGIGRPAGRRDESRRRCSR